MSGSLDKAAKLAEENDALRQRVKALEDKRPAYAAGLSGNGAWGVGLGILGAAVILSRRRDQASRL